ncbi:hypothetical protein DPMN_040322 [Dreissena polymorpha]|uniref:Uncharacterized protein n=1 Tax=Dreissena polymorpha TaxID=45954 RepID=A0A9D4HV67_DREPO|nr:hypothetical protein DPMN_040322 [Dreissena polymorpha]
MKTSTDQKRNGIMSTLRKQLEVLDFADDLALLSHTLQQMQDKTNMIASNSASLDLTMNRGERKVFKETHPTTHPSQPKARRWRRWTASTIS